MVMQSVNNHPAVALRHDPELPDGTFMEPTLFNIGEKDVEDARMPAVRTELLVALHRNKQYFPAD